MSRSRLSTNRRRRRPVDAPVVAGGVPAVVVEHRPRWRRRCPSSRGRSPRCAPRSAPPRPRAAGARRGPRTSTSLPAVAPPTEARSASLDGWLQQRERARRLGHAVADPHPGAHAGQPLGGPAQQLGREGGPAAADGLERRQVEAVEVGVIDDAPELGGHDRPGGHPVALGQREVGGGVPPPRRRHDQRDAPGHGVDELAEQARHVEQRRRGDDGGRVPGRRRRARARGDEPADERGGGRRPAEVDDVAVRQHGALRATGGAAGEDDRRRDRPRRRRLSSGARGAGAGPASRSANDQRAALAERAAPGRSSPGRGPSRRRSTPG